MSTRTTRHALYKAIGVGLLLAPVLGIAWLVLWITIYFGNGGDFGGLGAAPADPAWWVGPACLALLICAVLLDIIAMVYTYRRAMPQSGMNKYRITL